MVKLFTNPVSSSSMRGAWTKGNKKCPSCQLLQSLALTRLSINKPFVQHYLWAQIFDRPPRISYVLMLRISYDWYSPRCPPLEVGRPFAGLTGNPALKNCICCCPSLLTIKCPQECAWCKMRNPSWYECRGKY